MYSVSKLEARMVSDENANVDRGNAISPQNVVESVFLYLL